MKIVLAAVMYSPNLGDGLIAECLTDAIQKTVPQAEVHWLDLAGRTVFVPPSGRMRTRLLNGLSRLPRAVSQPIAGTLVQLQIKRKLETHVPDTLKDADLLVIGGGQLLADANLNFPYKLMYLVEIASKYAIPIAIHAVGVSKTWSDAGRQLFEKVLNSPLIRSISVRDRASAENLAQHYRDLGQKPPCEIRITPDPALAAADLSEISVFEPHRSCRNIGLGIVHPAALATHSNAPVSTVGKMIKTYAAMCEALIAWDMRVHLFTNGSGEDEDMLARVMPHMPKSVRRVPRAETPKDLLGFIRAMDAVLSHRLHACIAANAVGRKAVGLRWDAKMDGYFDATRQREDLFDAIDQPKRLAHVLSLPMSAPSRAQIATMKPLIQAGVRQMLEDAKGSNHVPSRETDPAAPASAGGRGEQSQPEPAGKRSSTERSGTHA